MLPHPHLHELTDYGDPDVPLGPKLRAYPLDSHQWRTAFLTRLTEVGYIGLIEASGHVYQLLEEPKDNRCKLLAAHAQMVGSGKLAVFQALERFLDDYLCAPSLPVLAEAECVDTWHGMVKARWQTEQDREVALINEFAFILDGGHHRAT